MPLIDNDQADINSIPFVEQAENPSTPESGKWRIFFKSGGVYIVDDAGTVVGPLSTGSPADGWLPVSGSWTYASASTIIVPSGAAAIYSVGDKIKLTQTTVKYFYVIGVADTVLTVTGGSDYTIANAAITAIYYSHQASPIGFPSKFNWVPSLSGMTLGDGTLVGFFSISGKTCYCEARLTFGSTSSIGSNPRFGIPVPADTTYEYVASIALLEGGVNYYPVTAAPTNDSMPFYAVNTGGSYGAAVQPSMSVPFNWGATDKVTAAMTYLIP